MSEDERAVLIVDDDPDILDALRQIIEDEGYIVACSTNGEEALRYLRSGHRPRLILLDLMMPVLDGWQFLDARRSDPLLSSIPVVVVSATAANFQGRGPQDQPEVNAVLSKPVALDRLLSFVETFCRAS